MLKSPPAAGRPSRARANRRYRIELGLMLAPYLIGVGALILIPVLLTFGVAFTDYYATKPPVWNNFRNFPEIFSERRFWFGARNSILFMLLAVPLRMLGALLLALLLSRPGHAVGLYRSAAYLPTVIPDLAYALIWLWVLNPAYGPLNMLLGAAGLPTPAWLAQSNTALPALVLMAVFQLGEGFVVLLAALHDIPRDLYQAAALDGGNRWQIFRRITLPLLTPWLVLLAIRDMILTTQSTFTPGYVMTGGRPYYATLFLPVFIHEEAFDRFLFGHAGAMLLIWFIWLGLLLWVLYELLGGWGYADEA